MESTNKTLEKPAHTWSWRKQLIFGAMKNDLVLLTSKLIKQYMSKI